MNEADVDKTKDELLAELRAVRERLALMEAVIENIDDAVYAKDRAGRYQMINPAGARMVGRSVAEVIGKDDAELFSPAAAAHIMEVDRRAIATESVQRSEIEADATGESRVYLGTKGPWRDAHGAVMGVVGISRDVTERRRAERAVARYSEILQAIFDHIPIMILFTDNDGRPRLANRHCEELLGWSLAEMQQGDIFAELYPDPDDRRHAVECAHAAPPGWHDFETTVRDGRVLDTSWTASLLSDGTKLWFGQDVTARKQSERELRRLARRIVEVQEEERRHLARELHDEIGQMLTAIAINIQAARRPADGPVVEHLEECVGIVDGAIQQVRHLSLDLRPSMLDDLGLVPALRWHLDRQAQRVGYRARLSAEPGEIVLGPEVAIAAFRVVQEALTNVARHARARRVLVRVRLRDGALHVTVRDDGVGFDVGAARRQGTREGGLGLLGMHERAALLGGRVEIRSSPGSGTRVRLELPVA